MGNTRRFLALGLGAALVLYFVATSSQATPSTGHGIIEWRPTLDVALKEAKASKKRVFVKFWMDGCPPCEALDKTTFSDGSVKSALDEYVSVTVKIDESTKELANKYNITALPVLAVVDSEGTALSTKLGYQSADEFKGWLASVGRVEQK